ncbi:hypothetical protein MOQ72_37155 [Saccharopolyspora sp. K220]|uniref:hypothetical protein n=1 Tax=Saccharopolyspora soli TaxID=2926618 RepID=UPI001F591AA1|nr:hypothetical protein [Saccharopolyspora soli]MCI2423061.1 hypothetical protein [Saccharopolyspora soli]
MKLTAQRQALRDAIIAAARDPESEWEVANGNTIRYTEVRDTPQAMRTWPDAYGYTPYDRPTYERHVFLSWSVDKPMLGVSHAPWTGRRDQFVTLKRAFEILDDPTSAF